MKRFINAHKKALAAVAGVAIIAGSGIGAYAYFLSSGSGTGTGATGTTKNVTVVQDSITYNGPGGTGVNLDPNDTATVAFGITNPGGNEYVNQISLASWTSNTPLTCDSALSGQSGWFTMSAVTVGADFAHGTDLTTGKTGTITFVDDATHDQTACAGKTITFSYSSN